MRVAVLGCGPAGLMAAHAATLVKADRVDIYSRKRRSELFGAQYLHTPIQGMTDNAPVTVQYNLRGSVEEYRRKVYGDTWDGSVSPEAHEGDHEAWDIRATYNNLWERYSPFVRSTEISRNWIYNFMEQEGVVRYDYIISTVPKPLLCQFPSIHEFAGQTIWAVGDAPSRGIFNVHDFVMGQQGLHNNTILCSGQVSDLWYRISRVFGYSTVEWPDNPVVRIPSAAKVVKPLSNTCDCWPKITHVGRFGKWEKGILSDDAFHEVMDLLVDSEHS